MPKEVFNITQFNRGIIGRAGQEDVPTDAAVYAEDVDPQLEQGILRGVHGDSVEIDTAINNDALHLADSITVDGTQYHILVVADGSNLTAHVYDTSTDSTVSSHTLQSSLGYGKPQTISTINKSSFIGAGGEVYWVGNLDNRKQFSGTDDVTNLSGWSSELLDHTWSEGLTISLAGSDQNVTEFKEKEKEFYANDSGTIYTNTATVTTEIDQAEQLRDVKQFFLKVAAVYDGYISGPLRKQTSFDTHSTTKVPKSFDLNDLRDADWYYTRGGAYQQQTQARVRSSSGTLDTWTHTFYDVDQVYGEVDVTIDVDESNFSDRITALKIYGATSNDDGASVPNGSYRLIKTAHVNDSGWSSTEAGTPQYTTTVDLTETWGDTYDRDSGIPEEIDDPRVDYRLSTVHNGRLYATQLDSPTGADDPTGDDDEDWTSYIVRSEPYQFGVFDWVNEFVVLDFEATALYTWNNRVYAFDTDKFVQINPGSLQIEETFSGAGAEHHNGITDNSHGLFFASDHSIHRFNGSRVQDIGKPIQDIEYSEGAGGWENATGNPTLLAKEDDLLIAAREESGTTYYYVYDIPNNQWWVVKSPFGALRAGYTDKGSIAYISGDTGSSTYKVHRVMDTTGSRKSWAWVSQQLPMGSPTSRHKTYQVRISGDVPTVKVKQGGEAVSGTSSLSSSATTQGYTEFGVTPSQSNTTQVRLEGQASDVVESVGIVYRRMRTP